MVSASVKRKKRGRPATGADPLVGVRLPPETIARIDRAARATKQTRSEAIRAFIERGLARAEAKPAAQSGTQRAASAAYAEKAAATQIDRMHEASGESEEVKAKQKRRLTKGPSEFRKAR
jgi:metal-responsive CopG/Arc/MetJ family transcriptional regulator